MLHSRHAAFTPTNSNNVNDRWVGEVMGLPKNLVDAGIFDVAVVGGEYGGIVAAISPARMGCKAALIQNRASKAPVIFASADGQKAVAVDETILALLDKGFVSEGKLRFETGKPAVVIVGDGPADGNVAI